MDAITKTKAHHYEILLPLGLVFEVVRCDMCVSVCWGSQLLRRVLEDRKENTNGGDVEHA